MAIRIKIPRWKIWKAQTRRLFDTVFLLVAMATIALVSCAVTMRLFIHASVEEVPNFAGMTMEQAAEAARDARLNLTLENRFYSATVPSGHILQQSPAPGAKVRRGWYVRVTESTGAQKMAIPDVVGMNDRDATLTIRKAQMDVGTMAHLPAPGYNEMVLAQTPPPNAEGVDKPQVSVLLSSPEVGDVGGYVMPNVAGLSLHEAQKRLGSVGLRVAAIAPSAPAPETVTAPAEIGKVATPAMPGMISQVTIPAVPSPPVNPGGGVVTGQTPQAGYRVGGDDVVRLYLNGAKPGGASATAVTPAAPATSNPAGTVNVPVPLKPVVPVAPVKAPAQSPAQNPAQGPVKAPASVTAPSGVPAAKPIVIQR